ncbi:tRNA (uracil-5-)-methyltransferase homolog A-like [Glandiceps talaboti]
MESGPPTKITDECSNEETVSMETVSGDANLLVSSSSRDREAPDAKIVEKRDDGIEGNPVKGNDEDDPYSYTRRKQFTSEIYKIEVSNLPKHYGHGQLKKMLTNQLKLKPNKIKIFNRATHCFVTFRCEEDREFALQAVNGHTWKKCQLRAKKANPSEDPLIKRTQKRKNESGDLENRNKMSKKEEEERVLLDDSIPIHERLNHVVTPLWQLSYSEQLKIKEDDIRDFLRHLAKRFEKQCPNISDYVRTQKDLHKQQCCHLEEIKSSPVIDDYRNKSEFSIGVSPDGQEKTVGFKMGRYKGGFDTVVEPSHCKHIPESMKTVVKAIQAYIQMSDKPSYSNHNHLGCWKQVTVRTSQNGNVMIVVVLNMYNLTQEDIEKEKESLRSYFKDGPAGEHQPSSLFLQVQKERLGEKSVHEIDGPCELLLGEPVIHEELLAMKFRISPDAFFQVNTKAAEVLYRTIREWSGVGEKTTVLDICCGTGTIGLTLAKNVKKVIGIEMSQQAIEDAKYNAQQNGVTNVKFLCGKAEDVLHKAIHDIYGCTDVVGILDPPRAGLHPKVIRAIRGCPFLNRLVYVSCSPRSAEANFIDLCRPPSNRMKGEPFKPTNAVPVDLFPHTKLCELIILFERERPQRQRRSSSPTLTTPTTSTVSGKAENSDRGDTDVGQTGETLDGSTGDSKTDVGQTVETLDSSTGDNTTDAVAGD